MGIIIIYIILFVIISGAIVLIIPPIATEAKLIANNFPAYYEKVTNGLNYFITNQGDSNAATQIKSSLDNLLAI
jgi:predicted PurR-regulated permease PerM